MVEVRIAKHKIWDFIFVIGYYHYDLLPELRNWIYNHDVKLKWNLEVDNRKTPFEIISVIFYFENAKDAILFKLIKG